MENQSARFPAGHFFLRTVFAVILGIQAGCGHSGHRQYPPMSLPVTGEVPILIMFPAHAAEDSMPAAVASLESTAAGWFYPFEDEVPDVFSSVTAEADSAGKLLIIILPQGEDFAGTRDHLVIQTDPEGIPVTVKPEIHSELLSDSLWDDPVVRQQTILQLIQFLKPDMILQVCPETRRTADVTRFWAENAERNNITVALFALPDRNTRYRGWGVFTGKGIENRVLEGMDVRGFASTVRMISGLPWITLDDGYPAMQAFYTLERE